MKSPEELNAIRDKAKISLLERQRHEGYVVKVSMSDCGIKAGARATLSCIWKNIEEMQLTNVILLQESCLGSCGDEPVVTVQDGDNKTIYVNVDEQKAKQIVEQHLKDNKPIEEYVKK